MPGLEQLWQRQDRAVAHPPADSAQRQQRWRVSAQTVAVPALAAATTVLLARQAAYVWLEHWYRNCITELSDPEASDGLAGSFLSCGSSGTLARLLHPPKLWSKKSSRLVKHAYLSPGKT